MMRLSDQSAWRMVSNFMSSSLPVVVIACKVFQNLIEKYLPKGLAAQIKFLDYGLHRVPKNLRQALQEQIDQIEAPSLVVLGYGLCGNGLDGLQAGKHTLLVPRTDDCIAIFLGSYAAYRQQFDSAPGTYYLSKGWLESGSNPHQEYQKLIEKYGQEKAEWLIDTQYRNYKRLALVAHEQYDLERYRPQAQEVANFCERWGVKYEEILGSDQYVRRIAEMAASVENVDDDFVLVSPGGELKQSQFIRF
jgi:hypothetical protein